MIPQPRPYQSRALDNIIARITKGERRILVVSPTGCHRVGQPVLMHDGTTVAVEDVKVGDRIMGPDSTPRTVLRLCRGRAPMFRVVPSSGTPFVVNGEHVLTLRRRTIRFIGGAVIDVSVNEYMKWTPGRRNLYRMFRVEPGGNYKITVTLGFTIDPLPGEEPFYGFTLDGDGRYLLGDFTVTHNSGKTVVFAEIIRRMRLKGKSALVIAGARELIFQASEKLTAIDVDHGVIMAGIRPRESDVMVGSIQSITRRGVLPKADIVIIDEADLARAAMYEAILTNYASSVILGFTASPWRSDGKGLGGHVKIGESMLPMFQTSLVMATPRELMDLGYLVPVDIENSFFFERPDTSEIKVTGGDYDDKALKTWAASSSGKKIAGDVIAEYVRRGDGKRAICFAASVDQSTELARLFVAAGVAAEHVDGTTDRTTRALIFSRVRSGATRVLCNVGVVTRGVDIPPLEIAIMVRPTKSVSLYLQMLGRPMRPAPGKTSMRILDHAGNFEQEGFGMPDAERDYSLSADLVRAKKKGDVTPLLKKCPNCFRAWTQDPCWHCGYKPPVVAVKFDEKAVAVSLASVVGKPPKVYPAARPERGEQVPPGPDRDAMVRELRKLRGLAPSRGWDDDTVYRIFASKFGFWPRRDLVAESERVPSKAAALTVRT